MDPLGQRHNKWALLNGYRDSAKTTQLGGFDKRRRSSNLNPGCDSGSIHEFEAFRIANNDRFPSCQDQTLI